LIGVPPLGQGSGHSLIVHVEGATATGIAVAVGAFDEAGCIAQAVVAQDRRRKRSDVKGRRCLIAFSFVYNLATVTRKAPSGHRTVVS